jgi:integrase
MTLFREPFRRSRRCPYGSAVARAAASRRVRGSVQPYRNGYRVRVAAGVDRLTGKRVELVRTAPTLAAAERLRTRLLAEVDGNRAA